MDRNSPDYRAILQNLLDRFVQIQSLLAQVATDSLQLLNWQKEFNFVFRYDRHGVLVSVEDKPPSAFEKSVPVETFAKTEAIYKEFCIDTGKLLIDRLDQFQEQRRQLDVALAELPSDVHNLLSNVRGRLWRPFVRCYCLIPLSRWPRLPSRERWQANTMYVPRRPQIPVRLDWLLEYAAETDPTDYWQCLARRIDSLVDNIVSIAPEFSASVSRAQLPHIEVDSQLLQVRLGRAVHNVTDAQAIGLQALVDANGDWVSWSGLGISKPSDVKKCLPDELKLLIETQKGKGYRLRRLS